LNDYGQLGNGTTTNRSAPVQIGMETSWTAISAGGGHTLALKTGVDLWAWGDNESGQLGDGTTIERSIPVKVMF
jgi:alpha-tubulin suppressor-like RCC1 family protein